MHESSGSVVAFMADAGGRDAGFTRKLNNAENEGLQREDEIHLKKCVKSTTGRGLAELMKSTSNY